MVSPARPLVRENPPENGARGGEIAGPEEKVDAVAERREVALFVPARRVQAERGVQLARRDVEAPAVESRVRDVVGRVRPLEAAPREGLRAAEQRDRLVRPAEVVREVSGRAREIAREAVLFDAGQQGFGFGERGGRGAIVVGPLVKLRGEEPLVETQRDGRLREVLRRAREHPPGRLVAAGVHEDLCARDVFVGLSTGAERERTLLLAKGNERAGRREPVVERDAARSPGRNPDCRFPRGLRPSRGLQNPHGEKRPAEIGAFP